MEALFLKVFNMGVNAGWLILVVAVLRLILKKSPRWVFCLMWALVAFRLVCPFSITSAMSLIPSAEPIPSDIAMMPSPAIDSGIPVLDSSLNPVVREYLAPNPAASANPLQIFLYLASFVWIFGMLLMLAYAGVSFYRIHRKVRVSLPLGENRQRIGLSWTAQHPVYVCDGIRTPFILGIFRPRIYVPSDMDEGQLAYVLVHEEAHLRRCDHLWKPFGFLILSVYWFWPICWLAYILFCRDLELCADESVIREKPLDYRKAYSEALLKCSVPGWKGAACPLAFGEIGVEMRIKNVLNYKKPAFGAILVALVAVAVAAFCFLSDPAEETSEQGAADNQKSQALGSGETLYSEEASGKSGEEELSEEERLSENEELSEEQTEILRQTLQDWAHAFCDRDGNAIASMMSTELRETMLADEDGGLLMGIEGQYGFGWSSPWPWDSESFSIYSYDESMAEIDYYALVSDPHVTCWRETLLYEWDGERYQVTGEELTYFDNISSAEEFDSAYNGMISKTMIDYSQNGLGDALNENALTSSGDMYRDLFTPESAAIMLLNLDEDAVTISRIDEESNGLVGLSLTFQDSRLSLDSSINMETEKGGNIRLISMYQPFGEAGIWIPTDYRVDVVSRFSRIDWNKVREIRFDEQPDFSGIVCLGELPEQGIRIYGYNDEDVQCQGVAIDMNGDVSYFDWIYTSPQGILPKLYWDEENRQLQIAFHIYTGTGAAADELYVLQYYDTGTLAPSVFSMDDYQDAVEQRIGWQMEETVKKLVLFGADPSKSFFSITVPGEVTGVDFVSISAFALGDTITFRFQPGYAWDGSAIFEYEGMPTIEMDVLVKEDDEYGELAFDLGEEIRVSGSDAFTQ